MADPVLVQLQVNAAGDTLPFYATFDGSGYTLMSQPSTNRGAVSAAAPLPSTDAALGVAADPPWSGSGPGAITGILKAIWAAIGGILNFAIAPMAYIGPPFATVGTTSAVLIPAGTYTRALTIQTAPNALTNVWLRADGTPAAPNTGILCQAAGGSVSFGGPQYPLPTGNITAITDGGGPQTVFLSGG